MARQTLETLPRRFNSFQAAKCFDLARRKYKLRFRLVDGVIAQLVERLNGIQEVRSSSLLGSTMINAVFLNSIGFWGVLLSQLSGVIGDMTGSKVEHGLER